MNNGIPSVGEVLELLATYRADLIAQKGEEWVRNHPISDEWGDGRTMVALLLQNPEDGWFQARLEDEQTRGRVHKTVLALQEERART